MEHLLESERLNRYVKILLSRELGPSSSDPNSTAFDPLKASISAARRGDKEEAFWLIFLFVHFSKHRTAGWKYVRDVYGRLGEPDSRWDWVTTRANVEGFRNWLDANAGRIRFSSTQHGFGNHRKYESLAGWTTTGTGEVVATYVHWVEQMDSHEQRVQEAVLAASGDRARAFDLLYSSLSGVRRFGRTARFDYLSMLGRTRLADIRPGKAYMVGATGPRRGAGLLFGLDNNVHATTLESKIGELERFLNVGFDVLEDALCNWQKSPGHFKPFRG